MGARDLNMTFVRYKKKIIISRISPIVPEDKIFQDMSTDSKHTPDVSVLSVFALQPHMQQFLEHKSTVPSSLFQTASTLKMKALKVAAKKPLQ